MMKSRFLQYFGLPVIFLFLLITNNFPQNTSQFQMAIKALAQHDTSKAEEYLYESIDSHSDVPSYILLADLFAVKNTTFKRTSALNLLNKAMIKYPDSLILKLRYAEILQKSYRSNAMDRYEGIIKLDSTCYDAWYSLGMLKLEEFNTYNRAFNFSDDPYNYGSLPLGTTKYAYSDLQDAEKCLKKCISLKSASSEPYLNLSFAYEEADSLDKAAEILEEYIKANLQERKDVYLYLGHIYCKMSQNSKASKAFSSAWHLMNELEKEDFTYGTLKFILNDKYGKSFKNMSEEYLKKNIDTFWDMEDPLRITEYNERLLEHYSRVAYANIHFSKKEGNIPGWKTNRGETVLRYGEPSHYQRFRPAMEVGSSFIPPLQNPLHDPANLNPNMGKSRIDYINRLPKHSATHKVPAEVFYYPDMRFVFADQFLNGDFVFNVPDTKASSSVSQFPDNTEQLITQLRKNRPESYTPKYEGPAFPVSYNLLQFRSSTNNSGMTDVYLSYGVKTDKDIADNESGYTYGIFFYNIFFEPIIERKDSLKINGSDNIINIGKNNTKVFMNSARLALPPDSGYLCFELIRHSNNGVSSNHEMTRIRKFSGDSLSVSDLIVTSKLLTNQARQNWLTRGEITMLPNPTHLFSKEQDLYVYYEVYNLNLDSKGSCNFEQKLTLTDLNYQNKSAFTKFFNSIGELIGVSRGEQKLSLVSNYNLKDKNQQMYLQLDLSAYEPGEYKLSATIKDKISGKETVTETTLTWQ